MPEWIIWEMFDDALAKAAAKTRPGSLGKVRLGALHEATCVQTLHVGPYDDEADVLAELHHRFIPTAELRMTGKQHEICLSDPRRVEPSRPRTIRRQSVEHA